MAHVTLNNVSKLYTSLLLLYLTVQQVFNALLEFNSDVTLTFLSNNP